MGSISAGLYLAAVVGAFVVEAIYTYVTAVAAENTILSNTTDGTVYRRIT